MRSVFALMINILVVLLIGGLNVLMRYLTQKQRGRPVVRQEAPESIQLTDQEPEEYFEDTVPEEAPATLFQAEDWELPVSEKTAGVRKRRLKPGPQKLRQAVIMSEIIREPRAQRPWPRR
ncbi:MAG TPA: hypothetical protein GX528_06280 [Firmicutes bacterium]|nr:hypothetical protein [Bacillota bacterium]